ncbi:MAG: protein-L-isoaspartate(D-aspartate) O-methyltransferase [Candidatus Omnitrophica bacterium]|nr:protein-L-isoaspartate(D-aspartate) O-methyltransferase [Candidatus Omnitrophota bacterium]
MNKDISFLFMLLVLAVSRVALAEPEDFYVRQREQMVYEQIKMRGVSDEKVLGAMRYVARHLFVPPARRSAAYEDHPLAIGYGQTISQPYIVAYMSEAALLGPGDKVLEIGTGSGYQAAILAQIVEEVYTIEIVRPLAEEAKKRLKDMGYTNIFFRHGDGYKGWPQEAPFDAIVVTAAPDTVPQVLVDQLKTGGRMVIPVGSFYQELYRVTKTKEGIKKETLLPVRFVPMVHGEKAK